MTSDWHTHTHTEAGKDIYIMDLHFLSKDNYPVSTNGGKPNREI